MAEFTRERIIEELKASTQNASGMFEISEDTICALMSMLTNAAPQLPQPAVDAMKYHQIRELVNELRNVAIEYHGTKQLRERIARTVRAAMLQGAGSVQGWIPCSERVPEEIGRYWCYVEEQNSLGKSHYQWNCSWNGDRWWVESENGGRVTHWMPLQAAPQQEVKSGR